MRITEVILENNQLDEITAGGVGQGIGKAAGNVVRGTKDFFSGIKQGYQQGRSGAIGQASTAPTGGSTTTSQQSAASSTGQQSATTPGVQPTASAPTAGPATAAVTVSQINKTIPALRNRDLQSVKKTVDAAIAKKSGASTAAGAPATGGAMGQMARNISTTGPSSTGGQTTATPTGLTHRARTATPESKIIGFSSRFLGQEI